MKIILSFVLLCQGLILASDVNVANALLVTAREMSKKGQTNSAEKLYLTAIVNAETVPVLLEVSAFYDRAGDKELAKGFALKAYNLDPASPEALKAASKYESGMLKLVTLIKEYNADLGKLAEKHPEPMVIDALENRIAGLGLERKWKKPFREAELAGKWEGMSGGGFGIQHVIIKADGTASYSEVNSTWTFDPQTNTLTFVYSLGKFSYHRQENTFVFQEGLKRWARTLKPVEEFHANR